MFRFDQKTYSEMADILDTLPKKEGGTHTRRGLEWAYQDIIERNSDNPGNQYMFLITGSQPSYNQRPCIDGVPTSDILQTILDSGNIGFFFIILCQLPLSRTFTSPKTLKLHPQI